MPITKYNLALNTFIDIKNVLKDVLLRLSTETAVTNELAKDDELSFWVNKCYVLLENYDWTWAIKKDTTSLTTTSGTSTYRLPVLARDKKPIQKIFNSTYDLTEVTSHEEYVQATFNRSGGGTPRRFCYVEKYTTARAYSTGTVSATIGEYTITGIGTLWLANLTSGSTITIGANTYTVAVVNADLQVTITTAILATVTSTTYTSSTSYPQLQIDFDPSPNAAIDHTFWYYQRFVPLILDADIPLLPINDRWVLADGAYSLYKWFHGEILKSGISPSVQIKATEAFLTSPATVQKFFNQYVAKMLADDKQLSGAARPKIKFKRGY